MKTIYGAAFAALLASGAVAQVVGPGYDFQPGDLVSLGPNTYPPGGVAEIMSCQPPSKPYRECEIQRRTPDRENHNRPITMDNYPSIALVGKAAPAAAAAAAAAAAPQAARAPAGQSAPEAARMAQSAATAGGACPRSPYGGPVPGTRAAGPALFQQKITDSITMAAYGPYWYGVRLSNFSVGAPIRNGVGTLPGGGASRVNNGAPVGATMYPVSTTMSVCEGAPAGSSAWRTSNKKYLCFVSASNEWTCGASN